MLTESEIEALFSLSNLEGGELLTLGADELVLTAGEVEVLAERVDLIDNPTFISVDDAWEWGC
jgi:hypothetical protein